MIIHYAMVLWVIVPYGSAAQKKTHPRAAKIKEARFVPIREEEGREGRRTANAKGKERESEGACIESRER